jgi:hypothetical protein
MRTTRNEGDIATRRGEPAAVEAADAAGSHDQYFHFIV